MTFASEATESLVEGVWHRRNLGTIRPDWSLKTLGNLILTAHVVRLVWLGTLTAETSPGQDTATVNVDIFTVAVFDEISMYHL